MSTEHINDEHNHFPIAAALDCLSKIARKHDREGLIQAARFIDMSPTIMLRAVSFLGECLEDHKDAPPMQYRLARSAIHEMTALCAVLLEINSDASIYRMLEEQKRGAA